MGMEIKKDKIIISKELTSLDKFVIAFLDILDNLKINYVIVSGYPAILLGRSRATEDVDIIVSSMKKDKLEEIIKKADEAGMWVVNSGSTGELLEMMAESNIRFAEKGMGVPNIEFKFVKSDLEEYSLNNRILIELNSRHVFIGCIELQIAYKLYLGAEKDIEDAMHIFSICKGILNMEELKKFLNMLKISESIKRELFGESNENRRYKD